MTDLTRPDRWSAPAPVAPTSVVGGAAGCSAALLLLLGGCTTYVPVVPDALRCNTPDALLQSCDAPQQLRDGISYAELLTAYQADRQALQRCATRQEALRQAVQTCGQAIDAHNASLGKLNDEIKAHQR